MVIEEALAGRDVFRLQRIEFDADEGIVSATFQVSLPAHIEILAVLGDVPLSARLDWAGGALRGFLLTLDVPQIRRLVEHFADPRTPKTPEADAIFNRVIAILGTFRRDLL